MSGTIGTADELRRRVADRRDEISTFLEWSCAHERAALETGERWRSLRLENRPDIKHAAEAAELFPKAWWGVVVFTCFGSRVGVRVVKDAFRQPLAEPAAWEALRPLSFPRGSIGHHRIQPGHTGAKKALVAASEHADFFRDVLFSDATFEERYWQIRRPQLPQWGRTTTFDLLLRAGALGVGGEPYAPTTAYLAGSTGPKKGFEKIWGVSLDRLGAEWGEQLLRTWTENWEEVAAGVGVTWDVGPPYEPGDFENALCIWQERR